MRYEDRLEIERLVKERHSGRYKDDVAGFIAEVKRMTETFKPIEANAAPNVKKGKH